MSFIGKNWGVWDAVGKRRRSILLGTVFLAAIWAVVTMLATPAEAWRHKGGKSVPVGTITVDGNPADWIAAGIPKLIIDPVGDGGQAGTDLVSIRVADDGDKVYFLFELAGPPVPFSFFGLDVDTNPNTGCAAYGVGMEYGITIDPSPGGLVYIGDARDCGWGSGDFPGALVTATGGNFIEASVPIATLRVLNAALSQFDLGCGTDSCTVHRYVLGHDQAHGGH